MLQEAMINVFLLIFILRFSESTVMAALQCLQERCQGERNTLDQITMDLHPFPRAFSKAAHVGRYSYVAFSFPSLPKRDNKMDAILISRVSSCHLQLDRPVRRKRQGH
eukprot:1159498-Pelagomonas_calceolata.AAC.9